MKLKTKIKLGIAGVAGGVIAGITFSKALDRFVEQTLGQKGILEIKHKLMSKKNQEDFANSPEVILGQLFHVSTPQINISIPNSEGRHINALLYKRNDEESRYAIVVHGYRSTAKSVSYLARRYYEAGYNVLVPYLRAHQGSDYEFCTMGWFERLDIIDWINYIDSKAENAKIVLHGVSMGAATVMMTTGESLPSCVVCAIEDCGYTAVYDAYTSRMPKHMRIAAAPAINIFRSAIKKRVGFDVKEASALNQVRKSSTPTLFLHGDADAVVPVHMVEELYANAACEKDIIIFKHADHTMSPLLYPNEYWGKVFEFIEKHEK